MTFFPIKLKSKAFLLIIILVIFSNVALACPLVKRRLIDYNCDQKFKIAVVGDSIARGRGDEVNGDQGGYPKRLEKVANVVENLGVNGQTTRGLLLSLKRAKRKEIRKLKESDIVIIDIGRNDYFDYLDEQLTIEQVVRNIRRIGNTISKLVAEGDPTKRPFILTGTSIRVNRTDQNIYIGELNDVIRRFHAQNKLPAYLEFDRIFSKSNLNSDNLHPTSAGYDQIFEYLRKFIRRELQTIMALDRLDSDNDGIFDLFEPLFGMDPNNPDTDSDGTLDGAEVFPS